jgi:hypothetical protein
MVVGRDSRGQSEEAKMEELEDQVMKRGVS